ncbi:hypothetical protein GCM10007086_00580 [Photobacterium aphoticum]|nr:hypothetical protein GCM10007086_00580 [Photobacterium aphoticum]
MRLIRGIFYHGSIPMKWKCGREMAATITRENPRGGDEKKNIVINVTYWH